MTTAVLPSRAPDNAAQVCGASRVRPTRSVGRQLFIGAAAVLVLVELFLGRAALESAAAAVTTASGRWVLLAAAASVTSMWCFGAVRQQTLSAAGVEVAVGRAVSMSYAAGAIHTTLPGGAVFSTAYAFRKVRSWGASTSVATWCMAITGVLGAGTLAVVGLGGLVLDGGLSVSGTQLILELGLLVSVLAMLVEATRAPERLLPVAKYGLRVVNRFRRKPAETGYAPLTSVIHELRTIRPSGRQWGCVFGLSLGNWLFDAASLWACCAAVGVNVSLPAVLLTYTAGMAAVSVSPLPAGIGIVEGALTLGLTAAGAAAPAALAAALIYRVFSTGGVALIGWAVLGVDRQRTIRSATAGDHPGETAKSRNPAGLTGAGLATYDRSGKPRFRTKIEVRSNPPFTFDHHSDAIARDATPGSHP